MELIARDLWFQLTQKLNNILPRNSALASKLQNCHCQALNFLHLIIKHLSLLANNYQHCHIFCLRARTLHFNKLHRIIMGGTTLYVTVSSIKGTRIMVPSASLSELGSLLGCSNHFSVFHGWYSLSHNERITELTSCSNVGLRFWYARSRPCLRIRTVCLPDVTIFLIGFEHDAIRCECECDRDLSIIPMFSQASTSSSSVFTVYYPPFSSSLSSHPMKTRALLHHFNPSLPRSIEREQIDCDYVGY